jgi:galactose mutarotase-like enzyme
MSTSFDSLFIENGTTRVGVNPQGGYVTSWTRNGRDVLYVGSVMKRGGIPVCFPYFGRSERLRMHGFGRDSLWRVVEQDEKSVRMQLTSEDISADAREEYPYVFDSFVYLELAEDSLTYSLTVENRGDVALPLSPGLHPYWALPHADKSRIAIEGISGFDATRVDWDEMPPDTVYDFSGGVRVRLPDRVISIDDVSAVPVVKHVVVWSQTPLRDTDFDFVCVEPTCGDHYGIDRAPLMVPCGNTWRMRIQFGVVFT